MNPRGPARVDATQASKCIDAPPSFQVMSLTPTGSGFTAQLNADIDDSALNLYDAEAADAGPSDVTLQGAATGVVSGSLIVDPLLRQLTFVKTGGPLLADDYTVTLMSGETAFKDAAGNLLDGDADGNAGDNFTNTFAVAAADPVIVSIPDFVRGPGQEVHLPADVTTGIPLTISNGTGVRSAVIPSATIQLC